nr:hypothetical protein [Tanacetum cinerariifolium]
MQKKKNDVKARTALLLSLPDEHQLRFNKYKTAIELWAAILKTFGGNEATKKRKKNLLKQQYGNFKAEGTETLEQTFNRLQVIIDEDDMEEMDIKWNMALLSMRADKFWKRTRKKISIQGSDVAGFDKSKVECFNCHKMGHFARECRAPRSQERGRKENYRQGSKAKEKSSKALMAIDGVGWDWSYMENEEDHALVADGVAPTEFALMANIENKVFDNSLCSNEWRLTEYKEREVKYIEKIRILEMYRASNLDSIKILTKELEEVKLKKDGLDGKLAGLLKASKNLDYLIESQRSDQVKEGVGYNVVPSPVADLYLSPKKDLSWTGLPEFTDDTVTDYSMPSPTIVSTSAEGQNKDSSTTEDVASPNPPKPFVKRRVQRETTRSQNHQYESSSHRSGGHRPHGAPMRPPLRSSSHRPHRGSMRPSHKSAGHRLHGPSMNPRRPTMNGARPYKSFFIQLPSYETRPFLKSSAVKTPYRAPWVPTIN